MILSPGLIPAAAAGELGITLPTTVESDFAPISPNNKVKTTIARMKFASGPATATSARW